MSYSAGMDTNHAKDSSAHEKLFWVRNLILKLFAVPNIRDIYKIKIINHTK